MKDTRNIGNMNMVHLHMRVKSTFGGRVKHGVYVSKHVGSCPMSRSSVSALVGARGPLHCDFIESGVWVGRRFDLGFLINVSAQEWTLFFAVVGSVCLVVWIS